MRSIVQYSGKRGVYTPQLLVQPLSLAPQFFALCFEGGPVFY